MSSINYNARSVLNSNVSAQVQIPLQAEQAGQFFSISQKFNSKLRRNFIEQKSMDMYYNFRMKTQTKVQKESKVKQQKTRKTRKDKQGRIFKCGGCSNDYLSYPALYTHIKAKHGGITPEGTMRGQNGRVKKRGRPKSRRNPDALFERETFQDQFPKVLLNLVQRQKLSVIDKFDIQGEEENPSDLSQKAFVNELRIVRNMNGIYIKTMPIVRVITIFLYNTKDYIEAQTMSNFQDIFLSLIKFTNKHYHQVLRQYAQSTGIYINPQKQYATEKTQAKIIEDLEGNIDQKAQKFYCQHQLPKFVPVFVESYLKRQIQDGRQDVQLQKAFLFDFCRWLLDQKLTNLILMKSTQKFIINTNIEEQPGQH